ncbi:hypothetical protein ACGFIW_01695 [Micromonospora sp. NPDC048935]|uniref:hypothetical protein n=1 Tax=Micromonospora sp. NPDC048935 TaxID=3364262 RepID=UPI0037130F05
MADPLWIDASSGAPAYSAAELRQNMALALMYDGRALGARTGVRAGGTGLTVSLAGSTITAQPGVACVDPGLTTPQGPYWVSIPAAETHTLTAADASNPRKDIIVLRVYDHVEDSSGLRLARTEYLVGTPNPSPVRPTVLPGMLRLATIDVPKVGSGSAVVTNDAAYTVAAGAILPVRAATDIAAGVAGRYRHRLDTGILEQDTGTVWRRADWWSAWGRISGRRWDAGPTVVLATISAGAGEQFSNMATASTALVAGRSYEIHAAPRLKATGVAGDVNLRLSHDGGGYVGYKATTLPNTSGTYEVDLWGVYNCVATESRAFGLNIVASASTGVIAYAGAATGPVLIEITDVGPTALTVVP